MTFDWNWRKKPGEALGASFASQEHNLLSFISGKIVEHDYLSTIENSHLSILRLWRRSLAKTNTRWTKTLISQKGIEKGHRNQFMFIGNSAYLESRLFCTSSLGTEGAKPACWGNKSMDIKFVRGVALFLLET